MATKEELEAEIKAWEGKNKYLVERARDRIEKGEYDKPKRKLGVPSMVKRSAEYYKRKTVEELKKIAKKRGIPKYYDLRESQLIKKIMESD